MRLTVNNIEYSCYLGDDGTLDTVIEITPVNCFADDCTLEARFDTEYASFFRDDKGAMTDDGFRGLALEAIENYEIVKAESE